VKYKNYCQIDSDCAAIYSKGVLFLGCGGYINKKDKPKVQKLINAIEAVNSFLGLRINSHCEEAALKCIKGKCVGAP